MPAMKYMKFNDMKRFIFFCTTLAISFNAFSQNFNFSVGTDVPYQYYMGISLETKNIDVSYRSGILITPYSDAILDIIEMLGTKEVYINLLDATFDFGWMNSVGTYYKFGKQKNWYGGAEFRYDYLTAADVSDNLIEVITGQSFGGGIITFSFDEIKLGLRMVAAGIRLGRSFSISSNNKHFLRTEFSVSKYLATQSILEFNGQYRDLINQELDRLLWEDVFKKYGYVGGIGFAYTYKF
jgi:hypothetical protein